MNRLGGLRRTLACVGILLVALYPALLGFAWVYESWVYGRHARMLSDAAIEVRRDLEHGGMGALAGAARKNGVGARLMTAEGVELAEAFEVDSEASTSGRIAEWLFGKESESRESLDHAEDSLGALAARPEIEQAKRVGLAVERHESASGETLLVTRVERLGDGSLLYLVRGSHRGIRRLIALKRPVLLLTIYQALLALAAMLYLGRRLARPLERLAADARRYPANPPASPELLARRDEIGEVARALSAMASDLEARRRATADLGADIAHEFKNPLTTIAASFELLESGVPTPEKLRLASASVTSAVERMRRGVDDLLTLVRLEAALPAEERTAVPVAELVESVAAEYRNDPRFAGEHAWRITVACAKDAGTLSIVRARMTELLRNLIDNALVQPVSQREIVIAARRDGNAVALSVRDFGPGVSEGNRDKIFRRFFTQRPAGTPQGSGLGLSIAQSIAHAHGGRIELAPDCRPGAEFRIVLPG